MTANRSTGIDLAVLTADLDRIAAADGTRADILSALKLALKEGMDWVLEMFAKGRLDGLETARAIAAVHENLLAALWSYATRHEIRAENPTQAERMALVAVGGFGRGEMAPHSDLDLLFLLADKKGSPHTEKLTEYILYMLWDMDLKVGQSTRTVEQCIKLSKADQTILTSLLDARHLCGDPLLSDQLLKKFSKDIKRGKGRAYIAAKLEERDARHLRDGNSRYVIEPDIKEGKGGLRDLHVLYWIARFIDRDDRITDAQGASDYVDLDLFDQRASQRFTRAADFLWRARIWLHHLSGRATETLSFDYQVKLARKMGQASGPIEVAVERFMREYFTNAREVGALTRIACAKLEAEKALRLPKGLDALLPGSRRNLKNKALVMDHGRLDFADPMMIRDEPSIILQLFETAGRRNIDIHPDAFSAIDFRRNIIDTDFRRDPKHARLFEKILLGAKAPYATLKAMNEAGVLGRYLIEFGGIVARTQFNMHHAYTVDQHTLRLVDNFHDLETGRLTEELPGLSEIAQGFDDEARLILYLTCLLHDTGKGQGDQCIEGAQLARRACRRLGQSAEVTDTVAWLVRRHLDMSETAQRRDISDPDTIAEFAELIGSQRRLDLLYVLTVCDIRSVGPGIWNDWKATLLRGLHAQTSAYLDGRDYLEPAARARSLAEQVEEKLSPELLARVEPILDDLPDNYWLNFDMADMLRHVRFFDGLDAVDGLAIQTRHNKTRNVTELWVMAKDRLGLFANQARAMSSCGASIVGARLHTTASGRVFNVFYLTTDDGEAYGQGSDHALETLRRRARRAAEGDVSNMKIPTPLRSRRAGAIPVQPKVRFLDTPSGDITILELQGRDKPGLLCALAEVLRDANISVASAHIEVVGATAIDTFYIRDNAPKNKRSPTRRKKIKSDCLNALDPDGQSVAA